MSRIEILADVQRVIAAYAVALDGRDMEALLELLSEDVVFVLKGSKSIVGRAAVREHCAKQWSSMGPTLHTVSLLPLVEVDDDGSVSSFHYCHSEHLDRGNNTVTRAAIAYSNKYRQVRRRLEITHRHAELLYASSIGDMIPHRGRVGSWESPAAPFRQDHEPRVES